MCHGPVSRSSRAAWLRASRVVACLIPALLGVLPALAEEPAPSTPAASEASPAPEVPFLAVRIPGLRDVPARVAPPEAWRPEELPVGPLELDLARAVALALERNPALKAAEEQIDEVLGGIEEARAEAFPQLSVVGAWSRSRSPAFLNNPDFEDIVRQFPGGDFRPSEQELWTGNVEVSQPLYTFGKIKAAIRLAELAGGVIDAQVEAARLETALAAAEAFYGQLAAAQAVAVVEAQQQARQEVLEVVEARYEIGEATRLEVLRARSSLAELGPELASRRGDVDVATARLRVTLGLPAATELSLHAAQGELVTPAELPALVERALDQRPELADLAIQREGLEKQQEVTRADGRPQLDFNGFYGRQVRLTENFTDPLFADWSVTVGMRWELFDGGRRKGQIAQLESQRQQLGWQLRDLEDQILLDIETARASYRAALERLVAAEVAAETAREAARVADETYREGVTLQADLLDARQEEVRSEIERIDAVYGARTEAARLARAVGEYPTETGWASDRVETNDRP